MGCWVDTLLKRWMNGLTKDEWRKGGVYGGVDGCLWRDGRVEGFHELMCGLLINGCMDG